MHIKAEKPEGRVRNRPLKDYAGQRWGRLTAVALIARDTSSENNHVWRFSCDCGGVKDAKIKLVRSGRTTSCGCVARETLAARNTSHGMTKTHSAEYRSWKDMRSRCNNSGDSDYADYGGRGITITPRWDDFETFAADMGRRPRGCTLDRIDVNGGYSPGNCRWADATVQANNKRSNRVIEHDGRAQTLQQWCREFGVEISKVRYRLSRGLPLPDALKPGDLRRLENSSDRDG